MANFHLYLSCALLLAVYWRTSTGNPLRAPLGLSADTCAQCSSLSKALLRNVGELLDNETLFHAVRCSDCAVVTTSNETVLACAPTLTQNSSCTMQKNSSFSESECLGNIRKDLAHYHAVLTSYLNVTTRLSVDEKKALLNPTLEIIQSLLKNCSLPTEANDSSEENTSQMWGEETFQNRQKMYQVMKGFLIRTITINRAMSYISSGDHRE